MVGEPGMLRVPEAAAEESQGAPEMQGQAQGQGIGRFLEMLQQQLLLQLVKEGPQGEREGRQGGSRARVLEGKQQHLHQQQRQLRLQGLL